MIDWLIWFEIEYNWSRIIWSTSAWDHVVFVHEQTQIFRCVLQNLFLKTDLNMKTVHFGRRIVWHKRMHLTFRMSKISHIYPRRSISDEINQWNNCGKIAYSRLNCEKMLFNLRLASSSMHLVARNLNWKYAIQANGLQSTRNYLTQNHQIEVNFTSRQLKNVNKSFHRIRWNRCRKKIISFLFCSQHIFAERIERVWRTGSIRMRLAAPAMAKQRAAVANQSAIGCWDAADWSLWQLH